MREDMRTTNVPDPTLTAREFKMLIVKLEWLGLDEEAERLNVVLKSIAPKSFVFVLPEDTD